MFLFQCINGNKRLCTAYFYFLKVSFLLVSKSGLFCSIKRSVSLDLELVQTAKADESFSSGQPVHSLHRNMQLSGEKIDEGLKISAKIGESGLVLKPIQHSENRLFALLKPH